jgi:hypothetical protein
VCFDRKRICGRIYLDEFFVNFVSFCVLLIPFRVPVGSGQDHARHSVAQFHLMEVDNQSKWDVHEFHVGTRIFYTKETKETKNFVMGPTTGKHH